VSNEVGGDLAAIAPLARGFRIEDVLKQADRRAGAACVLSHQRRRLHGDHSAAALTESDALFAFAMNGEPLPVDH